MKIFKLFIFFVFFSLILSDELKVQESSEPDEKLMRFNDADLLRSLRAVQQKNKHKTNRSLNEGTLIT